jgi:hypothetical protein
MDRLLKRSPVPADEKERLGELLRSTLRRLQLVDRDDPLTESIARTIIELDRSGVRDPDEIAKRVLKAFGLDEEPVTDLRQSRSRRRESSDGGLEAP